MLFLFVFSLIFFILLVFYTIQNRRKYGSFIIPLFFAIVMGGLAAWSGIKAPEEYAKIKNRDKVVNTATAKELTDEEREKLKETYQQTTGLDASAGLDTSMRDEQVAKKLSNSLSNIGDVTFDAEAHAFRITVSPDSDWFTGVQYIESNPGKAGDSGWSNVTDTIKGISEDLNNGFKSGYLVTLQGLNNPDQVLVSAKDGVIQYDFTGLN